VGLLKIVSMFTFEAQDENDFHNHNQLAGCIVYAKAMDKNSQAGGSCRVIARATSCDRRRISRNRSRGFNNRG